MLQPGFHVKMAMVEGEMFVSLPDLLEYLRMAVQQLQQTAPEEAAEVAACVQGLVARLAEPLAGLN